MFDPRRNMHVQGFSGRAATTTLHDATATGVSISGIFQAAEDFAVFCFYSAYDYFDHLRLKHLPRTDLSGLKLEFDIEYEHTLDGAMRFDAAKYPSVSWDSMTFVCGAGDLYDVRLLDHATVVSGGESAATCRLSAEGIWPDEGIDYLHLFFRDTRYTVSHTDVLVETQLDSDVVGSAEPQWIRVLSVDGIAVGDRIIIERTDVNEEETVAILVTDIPYPQIRCSVTINHPRDSYVTVQTNAHHMLKKMAEIINTPGESVAGRYGPDQSGVISAEVWGFSLDLTFVTPPLPNARYGKLGNLDRVLAVGGHSGAGAQGIDWTGDRKPSFSGSDDDTSYHVALDFTAPLLDKLGRTVPMNDCRKIYMVFAPRFVLTEAELADGCFLAADAQAGGHPAHEGLAGHGHRCRHRVGRHHLEHRSHAAHPIEGARVTVRKPRPKPTSRTPFGSASRSGRRRGFLSLSRPARLKFRSDG